MSAATLFTLLGLDAAATTEQVEAAWTRIVAAHDGDLAAIDDEVRAAYELLREPANLTYYAELLDACDSDVSIEIPREGRTTFEAFCSRCGIRCFERPGYPDSYKVRRTGQSVPSWVNYDAQRMDGLRMSTRERRGRLLRKFALGEVFQGRSRIERLWIGAGYVLVFALAIGVFRSVTGGYSAWQHGRAAAAAQRSRDDFSNQFDTAQARLKELETVAASLAREFQELTQIPLAEAGTKDAKRPRELDLVLIRHASVREAWTATINGQVTPAELDSHTQTLADIAPRVQSGAAGPGDAQRLSELSAWAEKRLDQLRGYRSNIDHIRVMMQADRFEHGPTATQGSHSP